MEQVASKSPGNTLTASEFNNLDSQEAQHCVETTGQVFNSADNTQLFQSILRIGASGDHYVDSGVANAYVVHDISQYAPIEEVQVPVVRFAPLYTNTGPSTIAVNSQSPISIVDFSGSALSGGELQSGEYSTLIPDGLGNYRLIIFSAIDANLADVLANETQGQEGSRQVGTTQTTVYRAVPFVMCRVNWDGANYSILDSVNVSSITPLSNGKPQINYSINLNTTSYQPTIQPLTSTNTRITALIESTAQTYCIATLRADTALGHRSFSFYAWGI